jgi:hypothetical protein
MYLYFVLQETKEEANIVLSFTHGKLSIPEPKTISENRSSVETQDKFVILEGPSTISAHKDANN